MAQEVVCTLDEMLTALSTALKKKIHEIKYYDPLSSSSSSSFRVLFMKSF